jgi:hypothetical protein
MAGKKVQDKSQAVPERGKPQKADEFADTVTAPFSQWWDYIKPNFKRCYLQLLKINIVDILLVIALLVIGLVVVYGAEFSATALTQNGAAFVVVAIVAYLLFYAIYFWLRETVKSTQIVFMHSESSKQPFGIWSALKSVAWKMARYFIINILLMALIALPAVVLFCLPAAISLYAGLEKNLSILAAVLFWIIAGAYVLLAYPLYIFLTQFWKYGFLAQGLGVRDALKESVRLVRKKPLEIAIVDLGGLALSAPVLAPMLVSYLVVYVLSLLGAIAGSMLSPILGMAILLIGFLAIYLFVVAFWTLAECAWLPVHYSLWKGMKEKQAS